MERRPLCKVGNLPVGDQIFQCIERREILPNVERAEPTLLFVLGQTEAQVVEEVTATDDDSWRFRTDEGYAPAVDNFLVCPDAFSPIRLC